MKPPGRSIGACAVALLAMLPAAVARADGASNALSAYFALLLVEGGAVLAGLVALIAALRSRARATTGLAVAVAAANGVMGIWVIVGLGHAGVLLFLPELQIALAAAGIPLVLVPMTGREGRVSPAIFPARWTLLWVAGHSAAALVGGQVARMVLQPVVLDGSEGSLRLHQALHGLIGGGLYGTVQWLLLRHPLGVRGTWILITAATYAACGLTGMARPGFLMSTFLGSALVGLAQWPLLRARIRNAGLWIIATAVASLVWWPWRALSGVFPGGASAVSWTLIPLQALVTGWALKQLAVRWRSP
jgi:hypothetical protein